MSGVEWAWNRSLVSTERFTIPTTKTSNCDYDHMNNKRDCRVDFCCPGTGVAGENILTRRSHDSNRPKMTTKLAASLFRFGCAQCGEQATRSRWNATKISREQGDAIHLRPWHRRDCESLSCDETGPTSRVGHICVILAFLSAPAINGADVSPSRSRIREQKQTPSDRRRKVRVSSRLPHYRC
jgi:hypothetical protein